MHDVVLGNEFNIAASSALNFILTVFHIFSADGYAHRASDKIGIGELCARIKVNSVVKKSFNAIIVELAIKAIGFLIDRIFFAQSNDVNLVGSNFERPDDSLFVMMRFNNGAHDATGANAVTSHDYRFSFSVFIDILQPKAIGKLGAKLEDIADFNGFSFNEIRFAQAEFGNNLVSKNLTVDGHFFFFVDINQIFTVFAKGLKFMAELTESAA